MLHPLPIVTFGDIASPGLVLKVYCSRCHSWRTIDLQDERLRARRFAGARFRCQAIRYDGAICGGLGEPTIEPPTLLPVGGDVTLAFLFCSACVPPWQINQVRLDVAPWLIVKQHRGDRFRCPGCRRPVDWHIRGPRWRPTYSHGATSPAVPP